MDTDTETNKKCQSNCDFGSTQGQNDTQCEVNILPKNLNEGYKSTQGVSLSVEDSAQGLQTQGNGPNCAFGSIPPPNWAHDNQYRMFSAQQQVPPQRFAHPDLSFNPHRAPFDMLNPLHQGNFDSVHANLLNGGTVQAQSKGETAPPLVNAPFTHYPLALQGNCVPQRDMKHTNAGNQVETPQNLVDTAVLQQMIGENEQGFQNNLCSAKDPSFRQPFPYNECMNNAKFNSTPHACHQPFVPEQPRYPHVDSMQHPYGYNSTQRKDMHNDPSAFAPVMPGHPNYNSIHDKTNSTQSANISEPGNFHDPTVPSNQVSKKPTDVALLKEPQLQPPVHIDGNLCDNPSLQQMSLGQMINPLVASCLALWDHQIWMHQFQQQMGSMLRYQLNLQSHLYNPNINQIAVPGLHMPPVRTYHHWKAKSEEQMLMSSRDTIIDRLARSDIEKHRQEGQDAFQVPLSKVPIDKESSVTSHTFATQSPCRFTSPKQKSLLVPSDCDKQGISYHEVSNSKKGDRPISSLSVDSGVDVGRSTSVSPYGEEQEDEQKNAPITPLAMKCTPPARLLQKRDTTQNDLPKMDMGSDEEDEGLEQESEMEIPNRIDNSSILSGQDDSENKQDDNNDDSRKNHQSNNDVSKTKHNGSNDIKEPQPNNETSFQSYPFPVNILNDWVINKNNDCSQGSELKMRDINNVNDSHAPSTSSSSLPFEQFNTPRTVSAPVGGSNCATSISRPSPWQPWNMSHYSPVQIGENLSTCSTPRAAVTPFRRFQPPVDLTIFTSPVMAASSSNFLAPHPDRAHELHTPHSKLCLSDKSPVQSTPCTLPSLSSVMYNEPLQSSSISSSGSTSALQIKLLPPANSNPSSNCSDKSAGIDNSIDQQLSSYRYSSNRSRGLNEASVAIMSKWFYEHEDRPYPSQEEKALMAKAGNITINQVTSWFSNKRNRSGYNSRVKKQRMEKRKRENDDDPFMDFAADLSTGEGKIDSEYITEKVKALVENTHRQKVPRLF